MNAVNKIITDRMIARITETGELPWKKPWSTVCNWPMNFMSKNPYRGVNVFMLAFQGYAQPWWISYKQAKSLGGQVRKGEKSTPIVFFKMCESKKEGERPFPILRYYNGFNVEQCEGFEDKLPAAPEVKGEFTPIESAQAIVDGYKDAPLITYRGQQCFYRPSVDEVVMAQKESFVSEEHHYCTLFHELTHSTMHEDRCNRKDAKGNRHGDEAYSKEELIAEMGASFLCGQAGIFHKTEETSAAYLKSWIQAFENDPNMIISAGSQAQKAFDHIVPKECTSEGTKEAAA